MDCCNCCLLEPPPKPLWLGDNNFEVEKVASIPGNVAFVILSCYCTSIKRCCGRTVSWHTRLTLSLSHSQLRCFAAVTDDRFPSANPVHLPFGLAQGGRVVAGCPPRYESNGLGPFSQMGVLKTLGTPSGLFIGLGRPFWYGVAQPLLWRASTCAP